MAAKKDEKVEVKEDQKPVVVEEKDADSKVEAAEEKTAEPANSDEKPAKAEDANTVLVQAIRSFEGVEGDKGPRSEPFRVSRQRYADLKANDLVELVDEKAGSDPQ
jgi:hypothetical protein